MGVRALIHQPSYRLLNRWVEEDLLATPDDTGIGCIAFSALAQGLLTNKYLLGIPADARMNQPATSERTLGAAVLGTRTQETNAWGSTSGS